MVKNIYKDKKRGTFYFVANLGRDELGRRIQKTRRGFKTIKEATTALNKFVVDYHSRTNNSPDVSITLAKFINEIFLPNYKLQVKESTYLHRKSQALRIEKFLGQKSIKKITKVDVMQFRQYLLADIMKSTANELIIFLKTILNEAVDCGYIEYNPALSIKKLRIEKTKTTIWSTNDFCQFMKSIPEDDINEFMFKLGIRLLFVTGMRFGEMEAVSWDNIDFDHNHVNIIHNLSLRSYSPEHGGFKIGSPKTNSSLRNIVLDQQTMTMLANWRRIKAKAIPLKENYLFKINDRFFSDNWWRTRMVKYCQKAKVPLIKMHALRHSHASILIDQKIDPLKVSKRLGHSNVQTTLDRYSHLLPDYENSIKKVLNKLIIFEKNF